MLLRNTNTKIHVVKLRIKFMVKFAAQVFSCDALNFVSYF